MYGVDERVSALYHHFNEWERGKLRLTGLYSAYAVEETSLLEVSNEKSEGQLLFVGSQSPY